MNIDSREHVQQIKKMQQQIECKKKIANCLEQIQAKE
jgi:hypothetical protein